MYFALFWGLCGYRFLLSKRNLCWLSLLPPALPFRGYSSRLLPAPSAYLAMYFCVLVSACYSALLLNIYIMVYTVDRIAYLLGIYFLSVGCCCLDGCLAVARVLLSFFLHFCDVLR